MKITVYIPVYLKPKRVADSLAKLTRDSYRSKEIVIIVDGPTNDEIEQAITPYKEQITLFYNHECLGKVTSLNRAMQSNSGDLLVFLDNDILLPEDTDYLTKVAEEFTHYDIGELPKEAITESLLSKMMACEFLSYGIACFSFSKISKRCPTMNGAAFAIKNKLMEKLNGFSNVINEDLDLAARAFFNHARFSYNPRLKVENEVPNTVKDWMTQRKRWATSYMLWLKEHFVPLVTHFFNDSYLRKSALLISLPVIIFIVLFELLHMLHLNTFLPIIMMLGMNINFSAGVFWIISHFNLIMFGIVPMLLSLAITSSFYFIFSRLLKFKFNLFHFLLFYFVYTPIWLAANIFFAIAVLLNIKVKINWKV